MLTAVLLLLASHTFAMEKKMTVQQDNASPRLVHQKDSAVFSLQWSSLQWKNLTVAVKVDGKWIAAQEFPVQRWDDQTSGSTVLNVEDKDGNKAAFTFSPDSQSPSCTMKASFTAARECHLGGFRLLAPHKNQPMPLPDSKGVWTVYSDDFSALLMGNMARLNSNDPLEQGCWIASVQNAQSKQTFAFAQLTAEVWPFWYEWKRNGKSVELIVRAGGEQDKESILVRAGNTIALDPLLIGYWENERPQNVLLDLAKRIGSHIHRATPMRRPEKGWSTWHYYFRNINEQELIKQAEVLKKDWWDYGFRIMQVDGGWWVNPGELTVDPKKFPNGLEAVSRKAKELGLSFGVHMSPFRMAAQSDFWKEHPTWGVRDEGSDPYKPGKVLDGSNPEVVQWITKGYANLAEKVGIDYYKFDFINQGAKEGIRHNPEMTGMQSYITLIRALRAALPQKIIINGCNALTLAGVDSFDTLRLGPDINHGPAQGKHGEYANMTWGDWQNPIPRTDQYKMTLMNEVRGIARQFYVQNNIAIADGDSFLVTPVYTEDEAKCHVSLIALTGGTFFMGDRLDSMPPERQAIVRNEKLMDIWQQGQAAIPLDFFDGVQCPRLWKIQLPDRDVLAIFNWSDHTANNIWTADQLWLDEKMPYTKIDEIWSGRTVSAGEVLEQSQKPHSVLVFEMKK